MAVKKKVTGGKYSMEGALSVSGALKGFSIETLVSTKDVAVNKEIITDIVRGRKSAFFSTNYIL